jgi:hypothetical protein
MDRLKNFVLRDRHTLLGATIALYILLVVIEGQLMDRESRVFFFDNPFVEINVNNIEEFESRRAGRR